MMLPGTKNGDTLRGPLVSRNLSWLSRMVSRPPMPAPMTTPIRCAFESLMAIPESLMAWLAAAKPYCRNGSMRRASCPIIAYCGMEGVAK